MIFLIRWLITALVVLASAYLLPGIMITDFITAIVAVAVLALVNAVIRPLLLLITLPINIVTLGLFTFVINAFLIVVTTWIVDGFDIENFWWALGLALILSVSNLILSHQKKKASNTIPN